jgi:hypothetical protein
VDDLNTLRATSLWPEFPFLRLERRLDFRFDQPICFLYASERDRVIPKVFFVTEFPPTLDGFDAEKSPGIPYDDLTDLVGDGWRIVDG